MKACDWIDQLSPLANRQEIKKILEERDSWWERESSQKWTQGNQGLPELDQSQVEVNLDKPQIIIKSRQQLNSVEKEQLEKKALQLIPWKKGPFQLFHLSIDAEWRSDMKWERMEKHLDPLRGKNILDIGCNNGYFLYRAASPKHSPNMMLGIDPVLPFKAQFDLIQHYTKIPNLFTELLGVEHIPLMKESFDLCFFMGIIYHHRNPIQQLIDIRETLKPGGQVILETLGIPGEESQALFPSERYARMKNAWFIPTLSCFINWVKRAKLIDIKILADTSLTEEEQRLTAWCPPPQQSLKDSLDPQNPKLTIEGYPAPHRFMLSARKKS